VESHVENCLICHGALVEREIEAILPPESSAPAAAKPPAMDGQQRIGPYRLLHELGRGGQARVYLVEDTRLSRRVALKVFQSDLATSRSMFLRFQREAAALSRLDDPCLCTVYETGEWEGCPFIAMRYVEGVTLARRIASSAEGRKGAAVSPLDHQMPTIHLIERVARALHVAHEAGLVHRDIKPSNIMIGGDGAPVLVDFGLVREDESMDRSLTRSGDLAGTPAYMSPEQIRGDRAAIDRRSDVFSLGVTLYEALTLRLPFDAPTTAGVFQLILSGRFADPSRASRPVPRDLKVILETALESDRGRRYQTALAFGEDLRRFRERETILARPAGPGLRFRRWTQRNPVIAVSLAAVFLILATALGVSVALLEQVRNESEFRAAALRREEAVRLAFQSSAVLSENPGQALLLAIEGAGRTPSLATNNAVMAALQELHERARLLGHTGIVNQAVFSRDGKRVVTASGDGTARVWEAFSGELLRVVAGHQANVVTAEFSPDGRHLLTAGEDATARIWDLASGVEVFRSSGHEHGLVLALYSPDGSRVLSAGGNAVRLWDVATGRSLHVLERRASSILCAGFSPDGARVVTGYSDGWAIIWSVISGEVFVELAGHELLIADARYSGDGKVVITASHDGTARVWDAGSGRMVSVLTGHEHGIYSVALDHTGEIAVTGGEDFTARIWEARTGKQLFLLRHNHKVIRIDLSRDGRRLLAASYDRTARVWDVTDGKLLAVFKGHAAPLNHVAFSAAGDAAVTSSVDHTSRVWSLDSPWPIEVNSRQGPCANLVAIDLSGQLVATMEDLGKTVEIFAASTGAMEATLSGHKDVITALEFSPDGRTLLTASRDSTARLWDASTGELRRELAGHSAPLLNARFSGNGQRIATASEDFTVLTWDAARGTAMARVMGSDSPFYLCSPSPDGLRVICGAKNRALYLADMDSGEVLRSLQHADEFYRSVEWSPDGCRIVVTMQTNRVQVRNATTGTNLGVLVHASRPTFAAYSPDGRWIATLCQDWITRIWDAETHREVLNLREEGFLTAPPLSFLSGGKEVAIHGYEGVTGERTLKKSRLLVFPLDPMGEAMRRLPGAFSPDERDQFEVGSIEERAAHRAAWSGGEVFGAGSD
jgi:WD40 repeat protein/tRNA A-37 threonylcarbamoyl transferase component Bud32